MKSRRFLSMLLAVMLTFTTVGLDSVRVYAEVPGNVETVDEVNEAKTANETETVNGAGTINDGGAVVDNASIDGANANSSKEDETLNSEETIGADNANVSEDNANVSEDDADVAEDDADVSEDDADISEEDELAETELEAKLESADDNDGPDSMKGLVLCDNGGAWGDGFRTYEEDGENLWSNYRKSAGGEINGRKEFLLGISIDQDGNGKIDVKKNNGTVSEDIIPLNYDLQNLKVYKLNSSEEWMDDNSLLGYYDAGTEDHSEYERECMNGASHSCYYFVPNSVGTYKIEFNGEMDESLNNYKYVTIQVDMPRIAMYYDNSCTAGNLVNEYDLFTDKTYYLAAIDEYAQSVTALYAVGIQPRQQDSQEEFYIYENGSFYRANKNDNPVQFTKAENDAVNLSDYFTLTPNPNTDESDKSDYSVTFTGKDFDIEFYGKYVYEEGDHNRTDYDSRRFGISDSLKDTFGLLFWIDGWDNWDNNPENLYPGSNGDEHAKFSSGDTVRAMDEWMSFVPGIVTDDAGFEADVLDGSADINIYKKNGTDWEDVTEAVSPVYAGVSQSENMVARGLWHFKPYAVGEYKLETTVNGTPYSAFYEVKLPRVGIYTSSTDFSINTLVYHDIFQEVGAGDDSKSYYLYGYDPDGNSNGDNGDERLGRLWTIYISWPEWSEYYNPDHPLAYGYELLGPDRGKSFTYAPNDQGVWVKVEECTDLVASVVKIEPVEGDTTNTLFKITPWPCDTEVSFEFSFGGTNNESPEEWQLESNNYFFAQSQKGLLVCDNGDGYFNENGDGGFNYLNENGACFNKRADAGVGDEKRFALAVNSKDYVDIVGSGENVHPDVTVLAGNVDKFTLKRKTGDNTYEDVEATDYEFGYKADHFEPTEGNNERYCGHYYLRTSLMGTFILVYNDNQSDILRSSNNYVTFNVGLNDIGLYTDKTQFDGSTVVNNYEVFTDGETPYYFHIQNGDENCSVDVFELSIWENGEEQRYEYKAGKFYKVTEEGEGEERTRIVAEQPTDISQYLSMSTVSGDSDTYEVVFAKKFYDISFGVQFKNTWYEGDEDNPIERTDYHFSNRNFGIRPSMKGELAVLDWFDYDNLRFDDDGKMDYTTLSRYYDDEWHCGIYTQNYYYNVAKESWNPEYNSVFFAVGIVTDDAGLAAIPVSDTSAATGLKIQKNEGTKENPDWQDTTELSLDYKGDPNYENVEDLDNQNIVRGLWFIKCTSVGDYRFVYDGKYCEFRIVLQPVSLYSSDAYDEDNGFDFTPDNMQDSNVFGGFTYYLHGYKDDATAQELLKVVGVMEHEWQEYTYYIYENGQFYAAKENENCPDEERYTKISDSEAATDLSEYFTIEPVGATGNYKVEYTGKECFMCFKSLLEYKRSENDVNYQYREAHYYAKNSVNGKLGVMTWLQNEFDGSGVLIPESVGRGWNNDFAATFETSVGFDLRDDRFYFVPGVCKDDAGYDADIITSTDNFVIEKKVTNKNTVSWVDVSAELNLEYYGIPNYVNENNPDDENAFLVRGVWCIKPNALGDYRFVYGDKTCEFSINMPIIGVYKDAAKFNEDTLVKICMMCFDETYYVNCHNFETNEDGTIDGFWIEEFKDGQYSSHYYVEVVLDETTGKLQFVGYSEGGHLGEDGNWVDDVDSSNTEDNELIQSNLERIRRTFDMYYETKVFNGHILEIKPVWPDNNGNMNITFSGSCDGMRGITTNVSIPAYNQSGLVMSTDVGSVEVETDFGPEWYFKAEPNNPYSFGKEHEIQAGETLFFALAKNASKYCAYVNNYNITRVNSLAGINVYRENDGVMEKVTDGSVTLKAESNGVFSFTTTIPGFYYISDLDFDGESLKASEYRHTDGNKVYPVQIEVFSPLTGLYRPNGDINGTTYSFNDSERIFRGAQLSADEAADGKITLYAVVDKNKLPDVEGNPCAMFFDYNRNDNITCAMFTLDSTQENHDNITYEKVSLPQSVKFNGEEVDDSSLVDVYKITINRTENYGYLCDHEYQFVYVQIPDNVKDTTSTSNPEYLRTFTECLRDDSFVYFVPADIDDEKISVQSFSGNECPYSRYGSPISEDKVTVLYSGTAVDSRLYEVDMFGNITYLTQYTEPGIVQYVVYGSGDFEGSTIGKYTISKADLNNIETVDKPISRLDVYYDATANDFAYRKYVAAGNEKLVEYEDYDITLDTSELESKNKIKATFTAKEACPYYSGSYDIGYVVYDNTFSLTGINSDSISMNYDGTAKKPDIKVLCNGAELNADMYTITATKYDEEEAASYDNITEAGTYKVEINGKSPVNKLKESFELIVTQADISKAKVTGLPTSYVHDEPEKTPKPPVSSVALGTTVLVPERDYIVSYDILPNSTEQVTITGIGNYTGIILKTVKLNVINNLTTKNTSVTVEDGVVFTYDGNGIAALSNTESFVVTYNGEVLASDSDKYYVTPATTTPNAGKVDVTIAGNPEKSFGGKVTIKVDVIPKTLQKSDFVVTDLEGDIHKLGENDYVGTAGNPIDKSLYFVPNGTFTLEDIGLQIADDSFVTGNNYTVTYTNADKAGNAIATFEGKGNYCGSFKVYYKLNKLSLGSGDLDVIVYNDTNGSNHYYTENSDENVTINAEDFRVCIGTYDNYDTYFEYELRQGTDYKVYCKSGGDAYTEFASAEFVSEPGKTYSFKIKTSDGDSFNGTDFEGEYAFEVTVEPYAKRDISNATVKLYDGEDECYDFTYCNCEIWPTVKVIDGDNEVSFDYDIVNNVDAGTATVIVTGEGNYTGYITKTFSIKPYEVTNDDRVEWSNKPSNMVIPVKGKLALTNKPVLMDCIDGSYLTEKVDYTYSFVAPNPIADGSNAQLVVDYKGNYTGHVVYEVPISATDITGENIAYSLANPAHMNISGTDTYTYTGAPIVNKMIITQNGNKMVLNTDYVFVYQYRPFDSEVWSELTYDIPVNAGEYYMYVEGRGKYKGTFTTYRTITVEPMNIAKAVVTLPKSTFDVNKDIFHTFDPDGYTGYGEVTKVVINKKELRLCPEDRYESLSSEEFDNIDAFIYFDNNKKPGTGSVYISGVNNYTGSVIKTFNINGSIDINDENIFVEVAEEAPFSPKGAIPEVTVSYRYGVNANGVAVYEDLIQDKDFSVSCDKNNKVLGGISAVTIKGKGKYKGTLANKITFTVVARDFERGDAVEIGNAKAVDAYVIEASESYSSNLESEPNTYINCAGLTYSGKEQSYDPKLKVDGKALKIGTDYDVYIIPCEELGSVITQEFAENYPSTVVNAGDYYAVAVGKGNYTGVCEVNLIVAPKLISKATVKTKDIDYTGSTAIDAVLPITDGKTITLVEGKDYEISYAYACLPISDYSYPLSSYSAYETKVVGIDSSYFFKPDDLKKVLKLDIPTCNWGGYIDSTSVGKKEAYVIGYGNYCGVKAVNYNVKGEDISKIKFAAIPNQTFSGSDVRPAITGEYTDKKGITTKYSSNGGGLNVEYSNNDKAGKATVVVTSEFFKGSKKLTFTINPYEVKMDDVYIDSSCLYYAFGSYKVSGNVLEDNCVEIVGFGSYGCLKQGKDYTVSYKNNKTVSTPEKPCIMTIKFKGNFKGTYEREFNIQPANIANANITATYDKKSWKPNLKLKDESKALTVNKDYYVTYYYGQEVVVKRPDGSYITKGEGTFVGANDVVKPGTWIEVVITGKGNYCQSNSYYYVYMGEDTAYGF